MARKPKPKSSNDVTVRMYRVGFGDCFLLTLPRDGDRPFRMLIDCGVAQHTQNEAALMQEVVGDVIKECGGVIDVLAVTHEHYDHVSGLVTAADLFLKAVDQDDPKRLRVRETWFAWTEDNDDTLARQLALTRRQKVERLSKVADHLASRDGMSALAEEIGGLMGFFGASGGGPGRTHQGMENARKFGQKVRYHHPGQPPITRDDVPGVRIWVLGPPQDDAALRVRDNPHETYRIAALADTGQAFFRASALGGAALLDQEADDDAFMPFDPAAAMQLSHPANATALRPLEPEVAKFLGEHYDGPAQEFLGSDQSWRRIDGDWLGSAADLALDLDNRTNNTSLVLAVELTRGGPVLLFAADAQVGNWRSWETVTWTLPDHEVVHGPDLLRRTAFYKVGHHGSQNATLKAQGLELMPSGVTAFIPVDHVAAIRNSWGDKFPLEGLEAALAEKTEGRLVRIDRPFPDALGGAKAAAAFRRRVTPLGDPADNIKELYYEWRMPMPGVITGARSTSG